MLSPRIILEVFINMYESKYNDEKESKEKEERKDIYNDKQEEKEKFSPSLTSPKEDKTRDFSPKLTGDDKKERAFKPSLDNPKEAEDTKFKPKLDSDTKSKENNFTPSLEMPEKKERSFKPDLKSNETIHENMEKSLNSISKLSPKFLEYINHTKNLGKDKIPNLYPNRGTRITNKFTNWIKEKEIDPFKLKSILNQVERINNGKNIQEIIKNEINTTNKSQKDISCSLKTYGLNVSPQTIKSVAFKQVYNNNKKNLEDRFPPSQYIRKKHSLDPNNLSHENINKLTDKFKKFNEIFQEYPNRGGKITNKFIDWIRDNEKDLELRNKLIKNVTNINEKGEIIQLALDNTLNTSHSLREISDAIKEKGIYVSHHAVADFGLEHVFKGDTSQFNNRFPKPTDIISKKEEEKIANYIKEEIKQGNISSMRKVAEKFDRSRGAIRRISEKNIKKSELDKIWIANKDKVSKDKIEKIREEVKNYYPKSIRKMKESFGVSEKAISRIAKEENSKDEYERKWPAYKNIDIKIRNAVINDIKSTNLNQAEIADKYSITRHSVRRFAKEDVYTTDVKGFKSRFPKDFSSELGIETHKCVLDEVTKFFNTKYDEKFISEPGIYPGSPNKGSDGLILNNENFLQKRLQDPKNTIDLSLLIHDIPAKSLNNQFDHIKAVQVDFTNDITDRNIIEKCGKYQDPNLMLYIVGTRWYPYESVKELPNDEAILYPENLKVINHELFADLIGLQGEAKEHYDQIIDLNYNRNISALKKIHNLNDIEWNGTKSLKADLIEKGLIRKYINEYFEIPRKSNSKQKRLI